MKPSIYKPTRRLFGRRAMYHVKVKALRQLDPEGAAAWLKANNMYVLARRDISAALDRIGQRLGQLRQEAHRKWVEAGCPRAGGEQKGSRRLAPVYAGERDAPEGIHFD